MKYRILLAFCCGIAGIVVWLQWREPISSYDAAAVDGMLQRQPLRHLGMIMDGNRRWAKRQGFKPWIGHEKGVNPVKTVLKFCLEHHIPYVTLYVFSLENLQRPREELEYLFNVLAHEVATHEFRSLIDCGVKVTVVGDRAAMPDHLIPVLDDLVAQSAHNNELHLQLLFCYGGLQEIVAAVQACCVEAALGNAPAVVTKEWFEQHLWSAGVPAVDLIVRTGGQSRLSNFLLFKSAYSDLYVLDCYWPDITEQHLARAVEYYVNCRHTFGK